jgi:hypothetical protein
MDGLTNSIQETTMYTAKPGTVLWHTTTHENAKAIMVNGFVNRESVRESLTGVIAFPGDGVWLSTAPAIDDELFDAPGMFGFDPFKQAFIKAEVIKPFDLEQWMDDSWRAGFQYRADANDIASCTTLETVSLEEVLRRRLKTGADDWTSIRRWAQRTYDVEFAQLVLSVMQDIERKAA